MAGSTPSPPRSSAEFPGTIEVVTEGRLLAFSRCAAPASSRRFVVILAGDKLVKLAIAA